MRSLTGGSIPFFLLLLAIPGSPARGEPALSSRLGLTDAVEQALASNLDLAARQRALDADREQIGLERAALLPQVDLGARTQVIDSERSDSDRGHSPERSVNVGAKVSQVLYDEADWASYQIQQHTYDEQTQQLTDFRLGIVQDVADAFLELARALELTGIQEHNRELTARNLETTRARVATGYSSQRELLRWESQLAKNDQSVVQARTEALVSQFELNRVRNRDREGAVDPVPVTLDEHGFFYARPDIVEAISEPEVSRRLRDVLVRVGLRRSPSIAALDAAIAAEKRLVTANERSFWTPSLTLSAGVEHLADSGNASSEFDDFEETEWGARASLAFPLFEGGGKLSRLRQSRDTLSSLRLERRSAIETVDEQIRSAIAQSSGSHAIVGFAAREEDAARQNYEFVNDGYVLGVVSILDLLDAQAQLLAAQVGSVEARYDFFEDLIAAERALAFYPFLEPESEVEQALTRIERDLRAGP